jgi:hypothetical protein
MAGFGWRQLDVGPGSRRGASSRPFPLSEFFQQTVLSRSTDLIVRPARLMSTALPTDVVLCRIGRSHRLSRSHSTLRQPCGPALPRVVYGRVESGSVGAEGAVSSRVASTDVLITYP